MIQQKQFIEDVTQGGWRYNGRIVVFSEIHGLCYIVNDDGDWCGPLAIEVILLDPLAWKAASRTRNWNQGGRDFCPACQYTMAIDWRFYMHHVVNGLAMGKTIEDSLAAIS